MAKKSVADMVRAKVAKQVSTIEKAAARKRNSILKAVQDACKALDLDYPVNGKTVHIVYRDRKIGVINTTLQAATMYEGKVGYVGLSVSDFKEWAVSITAIVDEQEKENG